MSVRAIEMGNCLFGGGFVSEADNKAAVVVIKSNGGIMEFSPPLAAESVAGEFPGHGLFRRQDLFWRPLSGDEELVSGESYFLLPLDDDPIVRQGHVRASSVPAVSVPTYRMSVDSQGVLKRSYTDVLARYRGNSCINVGGATWKVKLVICPEMLGEILAQEGRTQDLIDSLRTVAKCRSNGVSPVGLGFSDQWSFSSSRNGSSSNNRGLVDI